MSLRRPTVALLLFTFDISPLCDVAQTSDCGMLVIYFRDKPFMWCRPDVRLWHACYFYYLYALYVVSHRRPTVACLLFLLFISPLCGVAQTPDWGMIYFISLSRRRFRHSVGAFYFYSRNVFYMNNLHACIMNFCLFRDWRYDRRIFRSMIIHYYIIPVFIMFASTFQSTHWLVPGYCLG